MQELGRSSKGEQKLSVRRPAGIRDELLISWENETVHLRSLREQHESPGTPLDFRDLEPEHPHNSATVYCFLSTRLDGFQCSAIA